MSDAPLSHSIAIADPREPTSEQVEAVARAICTKYGDDYDEQPEDLAALRILRGGEMNVRSYDPGLPTRKDWRDMAYAGIAAYERTKAP